MKQERRRDEIDGDYLIDEAATTSSNKRGVDEW
jgi:hypothetical protein